MEENEDLKKMQKRCNEFREKHEMIKRRGTEEDVAINNKLITKPDTLFEYLEEHPEKIEAIGLDRYAVLEWFRKNGYHDIGLKFKEDNGLYETYIKKIKEKFLGKLVSLPPYIYVSGESNEKIIQSMALTKVRYGFSLCEKNIFLKVVDICQRYVKEIELGPGCTLEMKVLLGSGFIPTITFPIKDVMPYSKVNYTWIKESLDGMIGKKFGIPDENWDFKENVLFQSVMSDAGRGKVGVVVSTAFWEAFLQLECYKSINVNVARSFKSVATERIYELLVGNKKDIFYAVEHLKQMFCMESKYKNNGSFVNGVIKPAQKEMMENENCPMYFTFDLIRGERNKIEKIKFEVVDKQEQKEIDDALQMLIDKTKDVKLSDRVLDAMQKCFPKIDVDRCDVSPKLKWCQLNLGVDGFEAEINRLYKIAFDMLLANKLETNMNGYFLKSIEKVVEKKIQEEKEKHIDKTIKPVPTDTNEYPFKRVNIGKDEELNIFGEDETYNYYTQAFIRHFASMMGLKTVDEIKEKGFEQFGDYWRTKKTR